MSLPVSTLRLHHIGFVVAEIEASLRGFIQSLGASWDGHIFEDPHQNVKVAFLATRPGDALIELVEPAGESSPVMQFLKKGGGMHHVCYEVDSLTQSLQELRARGALLVKRPKPAVAFGGRQIAWILTAEKLLVELLETELSHS